MVNLKPLNAYKECYVEQYHQRHKSFKNTFDMSYDKIKEIMMSDCPHIWKWWTEEIRVILSSDQLIKRYKEAMIQLKGELESGILTEQRYFAEYELLCLLSGIKEPLNFINAKVL